MADPVTRAVAGEGMNQLATALSIQMSADSRFPKTFLYDYRADRPSRFTAAVLGQSIIVDRALWANGAFDSLAGWTLAGSETALDVANGRSGNCVRLGNLSYVMRNIRARSGDVYIPSVWCKTANAAWGARFLVWDRKRNRYLQPNGTWGGLNYFARTASLTYVDLGAAFTAELFSDSGVALSDVSLYVQSEGAAGQYVFVDDFNVWPRHSWTSIHGPQIDAGVTLRVRKSTDGFGSSNEVVDTLTNRVGDTGKHHATPNDYRYSALVLEGVVNSTPPEISELVMAQDIIVTAGVALPPAGAEPVWGGRHRQVVGDGAVYSITDRPARDINVAFLAKSVAEYTQIEQELRLRMQGAQWPCILQIDETSRPDLVFWGRGEPGWQWQGTTHSIYPTAMRLRGEAPPAQVA